MGAGKHDDIRALAIILNETGLYFSKHGVVSDRLSP